MQFTSETEEKVQFRLEVGEIIQDNDVNLGKPFHESL